ncbi:DUF3443 family protein [Collimonas sp.]|jgi:hypothetical protein|uniref:DUF3443 family protein n=1 Tax=Collimonas sp. TaxID=1963772 RepID=UPI002CEB3DA6|nr:DUF3443 family protein [Collimonas sp.]HWW99841.1 DUF3443 family protein [Collimonas sp.]
MKRLLIPVLLSLCAVAPAASIAKSSAKPPAAAAASNSVPMTIDAGPPILASSQSGSLNIPSISVTICAPGSTTNCQTVDHITVDTGSSGLHIVSSVLNSRLASALSTKTTAAGKLIAECEGYVSSYVWGSVKAADITIGSETAKKVPLQLIGDSDSKFQTIPDDCKNSSLGDQNDTVALYGSNGLIGVSAIPADSGLYFACDASGCAANTVHDSSLSNVLPNVVTLFAKDNNGVVLELPSVPAGGAPSVTGSLTFGIGTQTNNGLGSATVFPLDASGDLLNTVYKKTKRTFSYIDSGTNAWNFYDKSLKVCQSGYCPDPAVAESATMNAYGGKVTTTVKFSIADSSAFAAANYVYDNYGFGDKDSADDLATFGYGLPFFLGRKVFVGIAGAKATDAKGKVISGPFNAF